MADAEARLSPAPVVRPRRARRIVVRLLRLGLLVYLGLCAAAYLGQSWLVFPGHGGQGTPGTRITFGNRGTALRLTAADGTPIAAVYGTACDDRGGPLADAGRRPTVLYFYGNASAAAYSEGEFDHLRRLGANVIVPDCEGFGASGGKPSEGGCYAAADAAYDYVTKVAGADPRRVVAVGWSLGGGVAIDLAARRPVGAVAVFNGFTTMPAMAGQVLPWLPGR